MEPTTRQYRQHYVELNEADRQATLLKTIIMRGGTVIICISLGALIWLR